MYYFIFPAPNAYTLDSMVGKTVRAGKTQKPMFTMRPKFKNGAFYEDLAKVSFQINSLIYTLLLVAF